MELGANANSEDSAAGSAETAVADRAARRVVGFMVDRNEFLINMKMAF